MDLTPFWCIQTSNKSFLQFRPGQRGPEPTVFVQAHPVLKACAEDQTVVQNLLTTGQHDVFGLASDLDHLAGQNGDAEEHKALGQVSGAVGVAAGGPEHRRFWTKNWTVQNQISVGTFVSPCGQETVLWFEKTAETMGRNQNQVSELQVRAVRRENQNHQETKQNKNPDPAVRV